MEAKDTVISWERIRMVLQEQDKKCVTDNMFRLEAIAETQAEISFKAGIKEVVEWIEKYKSDTEGYFHYSFGGTDLHIKLKEWGLK